MPSPTAITFGSARQLGPLCKCSPATYRSCAAKRIVPVCRQEKDTAVILGKEQGSLNVVPIRSLLCRQEDTAVILGKEQEQLKCVVLAHVSS